MTTNPKPGDLFKGFDRDMKCRGFQYAIGETYRIDGGIAACKRGFHSCEMPLNVWGYYSPATSRFALVSAGGALDRDAADSKICSAEITIKAELTLSDFIRRAVDWVIASAKSNIGTGYSGHAAATGDRGHAAATGYSGHAAATGYSGHAAATGYSGHAAATGDRGHAAATGYSGHAAATGDRGHAAATGDSGHAAATGYSGHAAATGKHSIAAALGYEGTAMAGEDGWIVLAAWKVVNGDYKLLRVCSAKVGGPEGVKPNVVYRLTQAGRFVEAK